MSVHLRVWRDWEDPEPMWEALVEHVRMEFGDGKYLMRADGHVIDVYLGPVLSEQAAESTGAASA